MAKRPARPKRKHRAARRAVEAPATFAAQTSPLDDPSGPMGIRIVPLAAGQRATLTAPRAMLVAPIEAAIVELRSGGAVSTLDPASFAVVPGGVRAQVGATSPIAKVLVLSPAAEVLATAVETYHGEIDPRRFERYLATPAVLPRTNWVNELFHRYVFERAVCKKSDTVATHFLECELAKELYFLSLARDSEGDRRSVVESETDLVRRARALIEERLFEPDVLERLARGCGASESTLLRAFKRELGQGPLAFVRARRLDESMLLLKSRRHAVGEVALLVGYKNFAAFSAAFRARFGLRPSEVRA